MPTSRKNNLSTGCISTQGLKGVLIIIISIIIIAFVVIVIIISVLSISQYKYM